MNSIYDLILIFSALTGGLPLLVRETLKYRNLLWIERFGLIRRRHDKPIWIHASSLGELRAAQPLMDALKKEGISFFLTVMTPEARLGNLNIDGIKGRISYMPFDIKIFVENALNRINPSALILVEAELWPNLVARAKKRNIKIILFSGRLSREKVKGYGLLSGLFKGIFEKFDLLAMRGQRDLRYALKLGADRKKAIILGNSKFSDQKSPLPQIEKIKKEMLLDQNKRPILIAASIWQGEWGQILGAFARNRATGARLIIAPRRLEALDLLESMCKEKGFNVQRKTRIQDASWDILILDTFMELKACMALGIGVFVGGSLVNIGGHSPIEPSLYSIPSAIGPFHHHFQEEVKSLNRAGACTIVDNENQLARVFSHWLLNKEKAKKAGKKGGEYGAKSRNRINKALKMILAELKLKN